jgi:hypothetical protein
VACWVHSLASRLAAFQPPSCWTSPKPALPLAHFQVSSTAAVSKPAAKAGPSNPSELPASLGSSVEPLWQDFPQSLTPHTFLQLTSFSLSLNGTASQPLARQLATKCQRQVPWLGHCLWQVSSLSRLARCILLLCLGALLAMSLPRTAIVLLHISISFLSLCEYILSVYDPLFRLHCSLGRFLFLPSRVCDTSTFLSSACHGVLCRRTV